MKFKLSLIAATLLASPAFAAGDKLLDDTNIVVSISFVIFVLIVLYLKVPGMIGGLLDKRADGIKSEIDEARALREEAQTILASFERKQKEVKSQVEGIIEHAKSEAVLAGEMAKQDLKDSIARRLQAAKDQVKSAEEAAIREVKDTAVTVAIAAASEVIAAKMPAKDAGNLVDDAIKEVAAKLH